MKQIINKYKDISLESEDGDELVLELREKASSKAIKDFEKSEGIQLPHSLKELYLISDGLDLFGCEVPSLNELLYEPEYKAFQFHNWGNGDFDYISVDGSIAFLDNTTEQLVPVASSLENWIEGVIKEIQKEGALLHPDDFSNRESKNGLYFQTYLTLKNKSQKEKVGKKNSSKEVDAKTKSPANLSKIKNKFTDKEFILMEGRIARNNKTTVSQEDLGFMAKMTKDDLDQSIFSFDHIWLFIEGNEELITKFCGAHWEIYKSGEAGMGFTFLYGTYLCYIIEGRDSEFLEFLKKRSIPKVESFQKQLKRIYTEIVSNKK